MHREHDKLFETEWFDNNETDFDSGAIERVDPLKSELDRKRKTALDVLAALSRRFPVLLTGGGRQLDTEGQADYQMTLWQSALRKA